MIQMLSLIIFLFTCQYSTQNMLISSELDEFFIAPLPQKNAFSRWLVKYWVVSTVIRLCLRLMHWSETLLKQVQTNLQIPAEYVRFQIPILY